MTRKPSVPVTLSRMPLLYTAAVLLVVLPVVSAVALLPVLQKYWCTQFEIPKYEEEFGFTWGTLDATGPDGRRTTTDGITSVRANGIFAAVGIRAGDVPRMQHGVSSFCATLAAASEGSSSSLSLVNVDDFRAGQDTRREIIIGRGSQ